MSDINSISNDSRDARRKKEAMEQIVNNIINNDSEEISLSIREALERGWNFKFSDSLAEAHKKKEIEIERICSRHYSVFLMSVNELLKMEDSVGNLREIIEELHENFQSTGEALVQVLSELESIQVVRNKTSKVLDSVLVCKEVTKLMVDAKTQFYGGSSKGKTDFYAAMRSLEEIKEWKVKVAHIAPMAAFLSTWLATYTAKLLYIVQQEADDCIIACRERTTLIGLTMLRNRANASVEVRRRRHGQQQHHDNDEESRTVTSISYQHLVKCAKQFKLDNWIEICEFSDIIPENFMLAAPEGGEEFLNAIFRVLGPFHKALYMHAVLGESVQFHSRYRSMREQTLNGITNLAESDIQANGLCAGLPRYTSNLVGFFSLECIIRRLVAQKDGAFSQTDINTLWESACTHLSKVVSKHCIHVSPSQDLLLIREEVLLLILTVSDELMALRVFELEDVQRSLWGQLESVQVQTAIDACGRILQACTQQPIGTAKDPTLINLIRTTCVGTSHSSSMAVTKKMVDLDEMEDDLMGNSHTVAVPEDDNSPSSSTVLLEGLNYSELVPNFMFTLYHMLARYILFSVKNSHLGSKGDVICQSVFKAYDFIGEKMFRLLNKDMPLSHAAQIAVDSTFLVEFSDTIWVIIERILSHFLWAESIDSDLPIASGQAKQCLWTVTTKAQDVIFDILGEKIDDLLQSLEFLPYEPMSLAQSPHDTVEGIVDFLQIQFMCLSHLPQLLKESVHFTCCQRVARGVMQHLLSNKVKSINLVCIHNFDLDVKRLDVFADGCHTHNLRMCFNDLRELLRALLHPELYKFGDNNCKMLGQLYPLVVGVKLACMVDKLNVTPDKVTALPRVDKVKMKKLVALLVDKNHK